MVDLFVRYMEMLAPPASEPAPVPAPFVKFAIERPDPDDYLRLYRAVGEAVQWDSRLRMTQSALQDFFAAPSTLLGIVRLSDMPVGLCEFDGIGADNVELVHFGIVPEAHGRGIGGYLLDCALRACWKERPRRVWLHTDTNDHPNAVALYRRAGFHCYKSSVETFPD